MFPQDAVGYYCLLNTKEMRTAGEQNVLTEFTIISSKTSLVALKFFLGSLPSGTNPSSIFVNGLKFERDFCCDLNTLVEIKKEFPHVSLQFYGSFINFNIKSGVALAFNMKHNCYFSAEERLHFNLEITETGLLSAAAKNLGFDTLRKNLPAKSTVSINNCKGSVAILQSDSHKRIMENTLGYSHYMYPVDTEKLLSTAILQTNCDTSEFWNLYGPIKNWSEKEKEISQDLLETAEENNKLRLSLKSMYNFTSMLTAPVCTNKQSYTDSRPQFKIVTESKYNNRKFLNEYLEKITITW